MEVPQNCRYPRLPISICRVPRVFGLFVDAYWFVGVYALCVGLHVEAKGPLVVLFS